MKRARRTSRRSLPSLPRMLPRRRSQPKPHRPPRKLKPRRKSLNRRRILMTREPRRRTRRLRRSRTRRIPATFSSPGRCWNLPRFGSFTIRIWPEKSKSIQGSITNSRAKNFRCIKFSLVMRCCSAPGSTKGSSSRVCLYLFQQPISLSVLGCVHHQVD